MIELIEKNREVPNVSLEPLVFWLTDVIKAEGKELGDVSIVVGSDDWLLKFNNDYLNHDYFTDIITFDYCEGITVSGDLLISMDRVDDNAVENNVPRETEFLRVCVHGVLHLCGYGDKTDDEVVVMREKEDYYLCKY